MRLLIASPCGAPRFEGEQLLSSARRLDLDVVLFDSTASRDPTLDLPTVASRCSPDHVLIVSPRREEPATLELLRQFGATVTLWIPPADGGTQSLLASRRRWIATAADRVTVTSRHDPALRDRNGAAADVVGGGFDRSALGIDVAEASGRERDDSAPFIAVRAADDPVRIASQGREKRLVGYGDRAAFLHARFGGPLRTSTEFASRVAGRRYLSGARATPGPPSIFDDTAAATAAGAIPHEVETMESLSAARPVDVEPITDFGDSLRTLLAPWTFT